ncbi:MAG: hypothetical protein WB660_05665 [Candidatus Sulfotelmatobacter sp.]
MGKIFRFCGIASCSHRSQRRVNLRRQTPRNNEIQTLDERLAGDAQKSADCAAQAAVEAGQNAEHLRTFLNKLSEALKPWSLNKDEVKTLTDEFRPYAKQGTPINLVTTSLVTPAAGLALQIRSALVDAGFTKPEPTIEQRIALSPGISAGAPLQPLGIWQTMEHIVGPITKRFGLVGFLQTLPNGSPITLWVGPRISGGIPPLPKPVEHKPCPTNEQSKSSTR